jgi:DNA-binding GntR family transcriptional regulator
VQALRQRDIEQAQQLMRKHIAASFESAVRTLPQDGAEPG